MRSFLHTLRIEWLKLKYYRTFWILLSVIVVCIPAFNYVIYDFTDNNIPKINGQNLLGNPFSFPNVWRTVPYNAGILIFIPAILIITLFTNEYSYRTHRQNIIDGWSRSRFIYIKIIEVFLLNRYCNVHCYFNLPLFWLSDKNTNAAKSRLAGDIGSFFIFLWKCLIIL